MTTKNETLIRRTAHALFCLGVFIFIWTGIGGIDFGEHWDEKYRFIAPVSHSIETGNLLPGEYWYPSFVHQMALMSLIPDTLIHALFSQHQGDMRTYLRSVVFSHSFLLRLRAITVLLSSFTLLWVYLLVFSWRKNWMEALVAALLVGFSWEIAYHSRWLTVDPLFMQFGMLAMMCLEFSRHRPYAKTWLRAGAAAAALAAGTKYQGIFFLLPLAYATILYAEDKGVTTGTKIFFELLLVFGLVYLISTPGTLLEAKLFLTHLKFQIHLYKQGHGAYTTLPGLPHFYLISDYLFSVALSRHVFVAWILSAFALLGFVSLNHKAEIKGAALSLSFPVFYVIYFSFQQVMIVRNLLVLIPFGAVLSARGIFFLAAKGADRHILRWMLPGMVALLLALNAAGLIRAMESIRRRHETNSVKALSGFMESHKETHFLVSERLKNDLLILDPKYRSPLVNLRGKNTAVAFYSSEVDRNGAQWNPIANKRDGRIRTFGPEEVNFNYYPTWGGDERIVVIPIEAALNMGVLENQEVFPKTQPS